jgi:putative FmdB family regulatory protein
VPLYEYACRECGHEFEELVGSHVGVDETSVTCPECGAKAPERLMSKKYAPISRQLTSNQKRRLEDKRGTDRGGAMERFKKQRASEKGTGKGPFG